MHSATNVTLCLWHMKGICMGHWWNDTNRAKPTCVDPSGRALRIRPHWSQNRLNITKQLLSGHTWPDMCGYF